jgi:hypothetical protein
MAQPFHTAKSNVKAYTWRVEDRVDLYAADLDDARRSDVFDRMAISLSEIIRSGDNPP